jgi:hypothetical protein
LREIELQFLLLYENSTILDYFFSLFNRSQSDTVVHFLAVALVKIVKIQKEFIVRNSHILDQFVQIISIWLFNPYIIKNIAYGIEPLFKSFGENWVDMINLIYKELSNPDHTESSLILLLYLIPTFSSEYLIQISFIYFTFLLDLLTSSNSFYISLYCFKAF